MKSRFEIPKSWNLSLQQEDVIGSLLDYAGEYISTEEFCEALYNEKVADEPAPAKLRVLIQRCRAIVKQVSEGKVTIETRRNTGWRITQQGKREIIKIIEQQ